MPSSYSPSRRSGRGVDNDTFEPTHPGMQNIAARDGYDAGDGYMLPNPQLWTNSQSSSYGGQNSGRANGNGGRRRNVEREDQYDSEDSEDLEDGDGGYRRRSQHSSKYPSGMRRRSFGDARPTRRGYEDDYDSGSDGGGDRGRHTSNALALARRRSMSKIRQTMHDVLNNSDDEKTGNTQIKKWGATVAGALVGGLAAQQVGKRTGRDNHWVPTTLGAFIGGFTAREAEKAWFEKKAAKREEQESDEDDDDDVGGRRRRRSRSQGGR
jgi:hypothetical protein